MLRVLDKAQRKERDPDVARALRGMRDSALCTFTMNLHKGTAIYEHIAREVTNQVAMCATQHTIRNGEGSDAGGRGGRAHNTDTHTNNKQPQGGSDDDSGRRVAHPVLKNILVNNVYSGTSRPSAHPPCQAAGRRARTSFGSVRTHRSI